MLKYTSFMGRYSHSYEWNNSRKGINGKPSFFLSVSFYKKELLRNLIESIGLLQKMDDTVDISMITKIEYSRVEINW